MLSFQSHVCIYLIAHNNSCSSLLPSEYVRFGTYGNPLFVEAMLNSGNGGQRAQESEREHDGKREGAAGRSQLHQLRIGNRGMVQYLIEFSMDPTPSASGGGSGAGELAPAQEAAQASPQHVMCSSCSIRSHSRSKGKGRSWRL